MDLTSDPGITLLYRVTKVLWGLHMYVVCICYVDFTFYSRCLLSLD